MEGCAYVQSFCFSFAERFLTKDLLDQYCWLLESTDLLLKVAYWCMYIIYTQISSRSLSCLMCCLMDLVWSYDGIFQIYIWKRKLLVDTERGQTAQVCIYFSMDMQRNV